MKFREIFARKFKLMAQNEVLKQSYLDERRKLDYLILRDNHKNQATQSMINKMYPPEVTNPKPQYKFKLFEKKYELLSQKRNSLAEGI